MEASLASGVSLGAIAAGALIANLEALKIL